VTRVPDLIKHNPLFLIVEIEGDERLVGTAFVMSIPSEAHQERTYGYLVTARHCIVEGERFGAVGVRVNRRAHPELQPSEEGALDAIGSESFGPLDQWLFHEDPANDVAVHPFMPPSEFAVVQVKEESWATSDVIQREDIGVGDELVVVGLFASHTGKEVNRPIVRSGTIAAMPDEPLKDTRSGLSYDAYLAEVRSVGGLSGSPVWMVIRPWRMTPRLNGPEARLHFYLLGLIRGHWKKEGEWLSDAASDEQDVLNTGIAIVTPIQTAIDIINSPEEVARRRRADESSDAS
jgi:hypothetical protein